MKINKLKPPPDGKLLKLQSRLLCKSRDIRFREDSSLGTSQYDHHSFLYMEIFGQDRFFSKKKGSCVRVEHSGIVTTARKWSFPDYFRPPTSFLLQILCLCKLTKAPYMLHLKRLCNPLHRTKVPSSQTIHKLQT